MYTIVNKFPTSVKENLDKIISTYSQLPIEDFSVRSHIKTIENNYILKIYTRKGIEDCEKEITALNALTGCYAPKLFAYSDKFILIELINGTPIHHTSTIPASFLYDILNIGYVNSCC